MVTNDYKPVNRNRRAGVLLHPTSLPGPLQFGDLGHQAYRFIEFLHSYGFKVWQMLPIGPTHEDKSPYQCLSSHAGNPLLISLDWLEDKGWLEKDKVVFKEKDDHYRYHCLQQAAENFYCRHDERWTTRLNEFARQNANWLDDYALFMALKNHYQDKPWYEWPEPLRHRDADALNKARNDLSISINIKIFEQFIFYQQWDEIRGYAKRHDIELFGDMPIFVARDSADVWAERENFLMNSDGKMEFVSGVPPDAFSETGQRWGNPLYDWYYMQSTEFSWWQARFATQFRLFDIIRIDHFRGLQACWQIPGDEDTAINGQWVEVPGQELLQKSFNTFEQLPVVAEDLGVITEEVITLKNTFNMPGMKVLQFAFDGNTDNPHLPHCHEPGDVVYTGTHDNDTSLGWYRDKTNYNRQFFEEYTGQEIQSDEQGALSLIRLAMSSVSFLSVLPMQDLLMLDTTARMNTPGTVGNNWQWRFDWNQISQDEMVKISHLMMLYQR